MFKGKLSEEMLQVQSVREVWQLFIFKSGEINVL